MKQVSVHQRPRPSLSFKNMLTRAPFYAELQLLGGRVLRSEMLKGVGIRQGELTLDVRVLRALCVLIRALRSPSVSGHRSSVRHTLGHRGILANALARRPGG